LRFEKRDDGYYFYGPDEWFDPSFLEEEDINKLMADHMRGSIKFSSYESQGGYWMFEARTDIRYTCKELTAIAQKLSELNKEGAKP